MTSLTQVAANQRSYHDPGPGPVLRMSMAPPAPPPAVIISAHHQRPVSSAPVLNLPAITNPFASLSIPPAGQRPKPSPANPGYNEAHQYYDEMRQYYASKAYTSAATAELIIVKVRMVTLEPGKKNPTLISVGFVYFCFSSAHFDKWLFRIYTRLLITFQFTSDCQT
jgi:hypothetical protein